MKTIHPASSIQLQSAREISVSQISKATDRESRKMQGREPTNSTCREKSGLRKGPWTPDEDRKLVEHIQKNGYGNWRTLPKNAGLQRCGKSCRLRWTNYLRPDIKRGRFSFEEEEIIIQLHSILGNKWSAIAGRLPGRTDNEIKNYWNTRIRKRLLGMGIDPVTHGPRLDLLDDLSSISTSNMYHNNNNNNTASATTSPELLRLSTLLMSQEPQIGNCVGNYFAQSSLDSFDPTRLLEDRDCYTQRQNHKWMIQIQALQQQMAGYGSVDDPLFAGFYGEAQNYIPIIFGQNPSMNSVISTPSPRPNYVNNSNFHINNSSEADERENHNNSNSYITDYCSDFMARM